MKREIKFRVWNGQEMEYSVMAGIYGVFFVNPENGNGLDPKDTASLTPANTKYFDETPVMQFTGLKDKSGKEIYEGDILTTETEKPMIVKWNDKFASWCLYRDGWMFAHWFGESCQPEQCVVIGNRYENPELLQDVV